MPAKYVLAKKSSGFHWNLLATNGRVIASSEVYNTKAAAMAGIRSVQKNGSTEVILTAEELAEARKPAAKATAKKAAPRKAIAAKAAAGKSAAGKGAGSKGAKTTAKGSASAGKKTVKSTG